MTFVKAYRSAEKREEDLRKIANLRLRGWTTTRIAKELDLPHRLVTGDITVLRNRQARLLETELKQHLGTQLARMEMLLSHSLEGFEQSKTAAKVVTTRLPDGSVAERLEYHPGGDPKYLTTAKGVVESMNRLLGLDNSPVLNQTNVTVDASHLLAQPMSVEDYMQATQTQQQIAPGPVVETSTLGTPDADVQSLMDNLDASDDAAAALSPEDDESAW